MYFKVTSIGRIMYGMSLSSFIFVHKWRISSVVSRFWCRPSHHRVKRFLHLLSAMTYSVLSVSLWIKVHLHENPVSRTVDVWRLSSDIITPRRERERERDRDWRVMIAESGKYRWRPVRYTATLLTARRLPRAPHREKRSPCATWRSCSSSQPTADWCDVLRSQLALFTRKQEQTAESIVLLQVRSDRVSLSRLSSPRRASPARTFSLSCHLCHADFKPPSL